MVDIPISTSHWTPTTIIALGSDYDQVYLRVLLNSASPHTWIPSADCSWSNTWCREHATYNYRESHSYINLHKNFTSPFLDHLISGRVSSDQLEIGNVILPDAVFGEALSSNADFSYAGHDGVIGLSPASLSTSTSFLSTLLKHGLDDAVFSFSFHGGDSGSLLIGSVQHDSYKSELVWSKTLSNDRWQVSASAVQLGITGLCLSDCVVEFNTEVEVIVGPNKEVEQIYEQLDAKQIPGVIIRSVDCRLVDTFPPLILTVKGRQMSIPASHYVDRNQIAHIDVCILLITSLEEEDVGRWIMGTLAHKPLYVAYDFGRKQVGLASSA